MRRPIIAGNWKMNLGPAAAETLVKELLPQASDADCTVVVCPPFVSLPAVLALTKDSNIHVGAQNVHWAEKGAYTGEIAASMLKELGVEYVILGHSERREYFGETDETVNARLKAALNAGLIPILCVGESLAQREAGVTASFVSLQVEKALAGIKAQEAAGLVIAYEPIWAIGTGKTATAEQANETIGDIRRTLERLYDKETAETIRIQYGGSMNPKNVKELMAMPQIDGGLIGGASLKAEDFSALIHYNK